MDGKSDTVQIGIFFAVILIIIGLTIITSTTLLSKKSLTIPTRANGPARQITLPPQP